MQPGEPPAVIFFCRGGPLDGTWKTNNDVLRFTDGRYLLRDGVYLWEPSNMAIDTYTEFARKVDEAPSGGVMVIANPQVLGNNYQEVMESLAKLAEKGVGLTISHG